MWYYCPTKNKLIFQVRANTYEFWLSGQYGKYNSNIIPPLGPFSLKKWCVAPEFFVLISSHCSAQIWRMRYGGSWSIYFLVEWTICWRLGCCFQSTADSSNLSGKRLIKMCYWYEPGLRVPFLPNLLWGLLILWILQCRLIISGTYFLRNLLLELLYLGDLFCRLLHLKNLFWGLLYL